MRFHAASSPGDGSLVRRRPGGAARLAARHAPAARIAPVSLYVDACVAAATTDDDAIATWKACVAQLVPDADDELHADSIAQMHARRLTLRMLEVRATEEEAPFDASAGMYEASIADVDYEVNKAARPQRTVQSKDGTLRTVSYTHLTLPTNREV